MGHAGREMGILRKNQTEIVEIKHTARQMKTASHRLVSRLSTAEDRVSEIKDFSIEASKTRKQREERWGKKKRKKEQNTQGLWDNYRRCNTRLTGAPGAEGRKEQEECLKQ